MTKASRDTQGGRKGKKRKKERKRGERERERGRAREGKGQVFPATKERPGTHQRARERERGGGVPEYSIQEHPRRQRRKGGKGEEGGGPTNLALTTLRR